MHINQPHACKLPLADSDTIPLVVDLDGTLIYSDLLWEAVLQLLKSKPLHIFALMMWLLRGKSAFKHHIAKHTKVNAKTLPYDIVIVQEIKSQHAHGRKIILATGSHRYYASQVASHFAIFSTVLATDEHMNMVSSNKASELVKLFGTQGFDYIGNEHADIAIWNHSRNAYSVTQKSFTLSDGRQTQWLGSPRTFWLSALVRAMRPRQWLKNLLVFVPMLAGHDLSLYALLQSCLAFLAFSMCASSAYLLNDALDLTDDRAHPEKHKRPLAAGLLSLPIALATCVLLALAALGISALLFTPLFFVLLLYFVATIAYSFYLKRLLMVDVIMLALLYSLRIFGGGVSAQIELSFWLLSFSFFIFLSLALLKRHSELFNLSRDGREKANGRGYTTNDRIPVGIMGINCSFVSVVILMLYFNSKNVLPLYPHPKYLLGIIPLIVFWLGRLWVLSFRGEVNEDPIVYVSKDRIGIAVILCAAILAVAGTFGVPV
jgi:4-hydroxybenzoate polyprenyltransferase